MREPSALDRLAAWADEHCQHTLSVYRFSPTAMCVEVITGPLTVVQELDADVQVAAERVLARLTGAAHDARPQRAEGPNREPPPGFPYRAGIDPPRVRHG